MLTIVQRSDFITQLSYATSPDALLNAVGAIYIWSHIENEWQLCIELQLLYLI